MQPSTAVPLRKALALFGGLTVAIPAGVIPIRLFGHPWGDIIGYLLSSTCLFVGLGVAMGGRAQVLGGPLLLAALNMAGWEYFHSHRGEPLAIAVLVVIVLMNVGLLAWLRPWRRPPLGEEGANDSARSLVR